MLERPTHVLMLIAILIAGACTIHYFRITDRSVLLLVDDTLANVSVTLSKFGRYGLMPMPLQDTHGAVRTHGFYNYGPAPFLLGAALDWLFGTSYLVQRMIHPLVLIGLSLLALAVFRRASVAAAGLFAALVIWIFWQSHWPMFRPDITVCLFAGLGMAALTWAVRADSLLAWASAAFCITTAVTSHQIAAPLAPGMALVWGAAQWLNSVDRQDERAIRPRLLHTLAACILGGLVGLLIYAVAIEFRFGDLFRIWQEYVVNVGHKDTGWWSVYRTHFAMQWSALPFATAAAIGGGVVASLALLAASLLLPSDLRRRCLAFLLPGIVLALTYQAWLGFYPNYAVGYTYLAHVTVFWTIAAVVASLLTILRRWKPAFARSAEGILSVAAAAGVIWVAANPGENLFAEAQKSVSGAEYLENILQNVPPRSVAWGDPFLGLDAPDRVNLVNASEALYFANMWKPEQRSTVAPDFLIFGLWLDYPIWDAVHDIRQSAGNLYSRIASLFPDIRYELKSIVYAPPYGVTRIYGRSDAPSRAKPPLVALNRGGDSEWRRALGDPVPFTAEAVPPVAFDLTLSALVDQRATGAAQRSVAVTLAPGDYLLEARVSTGGQWGALVASSVRNVKLTHGGIKPFELGRAPYFPYEETVHVLLAHGGGYLYVSQFSGAPSASFEITQIQPISPLVDRGTARPLPALDTWQIVSPGATSVRRNDGEMEITGDSSASGYQLQSPPIAVKPRRKITVNLPLWVLEGSVGFGVQDESTRTWITHRAGGGEITLDTGKATSIIVVVDNANPAADVRSRFVIRPGSLTGDRSEIYVDTLTSCQEWRDRNEPKPEYCS